MKKLILVTMMSLSSAMAFADFQVYDTTPAPQPDNKEARFECRFRQGKGGLACEANAEVRRREGAGFEILNREELEARLRVRCNNGFDLNDHRAEASIDDGRLRISGRDDGDRALLNIQLPDSMDNSSTGHDDDLRASLTIRHDGLQPITLHGRCEYEDHRRPTLE